MKTLAFSIIALISFSLSPRPVSEEPPPSNCADPADFWLRKVGSGKPLFPGVHHLQKNTSYSVWATGGQNSKTICIASGGSGFTILPGSSCEDIGFGDMGQVADIATASTGSSVVIYLGVTCTAGNGSTVAGYAYSLQ